MYFKCSSLVIILQGKVDISRGWDFADDTFPCVAVETVQTFSTHLGSKIMREIYEMTPSGANHDKDTEGSHKMEGRTIGVGLENIDQGDYNAFSQ